MEKQVKSKQRVTDFGEVYTARRQVTDMLDLIPAEMTGLDTTYLEPACGNGNFLTEILARKLNTARKLSQDHIGLEYNVLRAAASIYGIDIQKDNTEECRDRLYRQIASSEAKWSPLFQKMLRSILDKNIICGDTLSMTESGGGPLAISEWDIRENGTAIRRDVLFSDMIKNGGESADYIRRRYYRWIPEGARLTA